MHILIPLRYQWDEKKANSNLKKHGVDFADAVSALADEKAMTIEDRDQDERRFITLGMNALGQTLVVVYTWRADTVRIISARKANRRECKHYEG